MTITHKLSTDLKTELKNADEIWVAVGLLNNNGLEFLLQNLPKTCKLNFIAGIDLPTEPKALSKILTLKLKGERKINAQILTEDFFHPKVYIVKKGRYLTAFVGSANCTNGGLKDNIEMSVGTKDTIVCKQLINWFGEILLPASQPLTSDFIKDYKPKYDNRIKRRKKEKEQIENLKEQEQTKLQTNFKLKAKFISELKRFRRTKDYLLYKHERQIVIRNLRKCLDYPNFKKLDLKTFFSIKELGTIVRIKVKAKILANPKKFSELMKYICNDSIRLKTRVDEALKGKLAIEEIGEAFISKILVIHNPKKYYLHNREFTGRLRPFGLTFQRGLSFGEKYESTLNFLKMILTETNIDDFAILDQCILMIKT